MAMNHRLYAQFPRAEICLDPASSAQFLSQARICTKQQTVTQFDPVVCSLIGFQCRQGRSADAIDIDCNPVRCGCGSQRAEQQEDRSRDESEANAGSPPLVRAFGHDRASRQAY
jgi:hypothetical protein